MIDLRRRFAGLALAAVLAIAAVPGSVFAAPGAVVTTQDTAGNQTVVGPKGPALPAAGIGIVANAGFTSPNPGVAHAAGSIICDNATQCTSTAGTGGVMTLQLSPVANGVVRLTRASLHKTGFAAGQQTNATFRIWLASAVPSNLTGVGDAGALSPAWADRATRQQYIDCTTSVVNGDNMSFACGFPNGASFLDVATDANGKAYAWIQAQASSYTALASEGWDVRVLGQPMSSSVAQ